MRKRYPRGNVLTVSVGPRGLCPDCGEATPFCAASALGACSELPWYVDRDLLFALATSVLKLWNESAKKVMCAGCREAPARLHWVERAKNAIRGPYCSVCMRRQHQDLTMYVAPAARTTYRAACAITYFTPKATRVTVDINTNLF